MLNLNALLLLLRAKTQRRHPLREREVGRGRKGL
jgi:hypothetical protein